MNRQQFISYIQKPDVLSAESEALLESLLKEYPFFQTAHLLYARNLFNQNSIQFNNQLKVAAAYSGDRKVLYSLIREKPEAAMQVLKDETKVVFSEPLGTIVKPAVRTELQPDKLLENIEQKVEKILDEKFEKLSLKIEETTHALERRLNDAGNHPVENAPVKKEDVKAPVEEIKPPKDIQLVYSIEKEFDAPEIPVDTSKMGDLAKDALNEAIDASVEMQMSHLIYEEKKKKQQEAKTEPAKVEQEGLDKNAVLPFGQWLKTTKRFGSEKEASRQQVLDLIEKFVSSEEPKVKPKAEFYSPGNMARKSTELDEDMITETLAKIFVRQKNYSKAIRAYESLSLKYPEKSAFFAAQIIEIKKLIKPT